MSEQIYPMGDTTAIISFLKTCKLPTKDIPNNEKIEFFAFGPESHPLAIIGLQAVAPWALLRSLAVAPASRHKGLGTKLVNFIEQHAATKGVAEVYLLTDTAEAFFIRLGYQTIDRESAPSPIKETQEFDSLCPAHAALMVKKL